MQQVETRQTDRRKQRQESHRPGTEQESDCHAAEYHPGHRQYDCQHRCETERGTKQGRRSPVAGNQHTRQQQQMLSIERQQRIKEELYLYLLNKREENALSQATTETDARVLDPAGGGDAPISPNGRSMIMAGVMKGIALPAIVLLLFLFFDTVYVTARTSRML